MHVDASSLSQLRTRNFETQVVTKPRRARHSSKYGIRSYPSVVVAPSTTEKNCKTTHDFQKIRPLFSTSSASLQLFARKQTNFLQIQNAENGVFVSLWRAARKVPRSGTGSAFKSVLRGLTGDDGLWLAEECDFKRQEKRRFARR